MILDEEEAGLSSGFHLRHVSLFGTHSGQFPQLSFPRREAGQPGLVDGLLAGRAGIEDPLQPLVAETVADRADERDAQLRVGLGEQPVGVASKPPEFSGPSERDAPLLRCDQFLRLERIEMLPRPHGREAEPLRQLSGIHRSLALEEPGDGAAGLARMGRSG